ncbi:MAG TPA: peptidoglycan DD-metalloendopeptidase family protein [Candidatus Dormibacteraeota bacterium]|nr:peptidoglycan DD-metalloendopeptidase family protein [Candidatus Dormibacteraeota bacterium]
MRPFAPGWEASSRRSRRPPKRLLLVLAILPLVAGLFTSSPAAPIVRADDLQDALNQKQTLQHQIADQKAAIDQLNAAQAQLRAGIAQTSASLRQVNADLRVTQRNIDAMTARIAKVQAAYDALLAQLRSLAAQIPRIQAQEDAKASQLADRKALLAQRMRDAYATGQTSMLETFLSNASFADILTQVGYLLDVGEQDKALALQIEHDQATLAEIHQTLLDTQAQTTALRDQTAAQKAQLDRQLAALAAAKAQLKELQAQTARTLAAQQAAYAKAAANKAAYQKAMAQADAAQRALQAKIDEIIREQAARGNVPSQYNGTFIWPMAGYVSQEFGCTGVIWEPPLGSCAHFHQGIDIVAPCGTPIHAAADGQVAYIGWNYADGPDPAWIVVIAHAANLQTWYAHMRGDTYPVSPGQSVSQGQVIGYEDTTGHSTGCHLHWAVELNGTMVNPRLFL